MDKKKTLSAVVLLLMAVLFLGSSVKAQTPASLQFCNRSYDYGIGNDTVKINFNITGADGKRISTLETDAFNQYASF